MEKSTHIFTIIKYQKKVLNLSVILIDYVFRIGKNYYPQVFLNECKFVAKEKKLPKYVTDDAETSSVNSNREHSDVENFNEEN